MPIRQILLLDDNSSNNISDTNSLIIMFNSIEKTSSYPYISVYPKIKRNCFSSKKNT